MPSSANEQRTIVLLTIHGMGFQQAPLPDGTPGYADGLHEHLSRYLGEDLLSDDPQRAAGRKNRGNQGPIYVHSQWPPASGQVEHGMERLGSWRSREKREVKIDDPAYVLAEAGRRIAHVALVYADLKDDERHLLALGEGGVKAIVNLDNYSTVRAFARDLVLDVKAMFFHPEPKPSEGGSSLRVRDDPYQVPLDANELPDPTRKGEKAVRAESSSGLLEVVRRLEMDVTTYLARNDHRERVRSFVRDALMRLCFRQDVAAVVINAHSLGTVVAFDTVRTLAPHATCRLRAFVTAGSPLRKFATMYQWGDEVRGLATMALPGTWLNFYDERDPVADRLNPPRFWQEGEPVPIRDEDGLYRVPRREYDGEIPDEEQRVPGFFAALDEINGVYRPFSVEDRRVNNVENSRGGGMQAHNYWDNDEVVSRLAHLLREVSHQVDGGLSTG